MSAFDEYVESLIDELTLRASEPRQLEIQDHLIIPQSFQCPHCNSKGSKPIEVLKASFPALLEYQCNSCSSQFRIEEKNDWG